MINISREEYEHLRLFVAVKSKNEALAMLREKLSTALLLPKEGIPDDVVVLNSRVTYLDLDSRERETYTVTLPQQASADDGRLSVLSPLGVALIGCREGDVVKCVAPGGERSILIEKVTSGESDHHSNRMPASALAPGIG